MDNSLSEREQKYYHAVFKAKNNITFQSNNSIRLFQLVDVHCKTSNETNAMHHQSCEEITFVYSGEGEVLHNDKRYKIRSGDVHICFNEDNHQLISSKTAPLRFFCIGYTVSHKNPLHALVKKAQEQIGAGADPVMNVGFSLQPAFRSALSVLYSGESDSVSQAVVSNTLNYIIYSVMNEFLNKFQARTDTISMTGSLLFYIVSYLKNNVYNIDALKTLPDDVGYSYSYISHLFSENMGQSLKEFFLSLRISEATELLKTKSVTEVSSALGYSSIHAFTRAYKQMCGETPSEAKEKMRKNDTLNLYL